MKRLTQTQIDSITSNILSEQLNFKSNKIQPTDIATYKRNVKQGEEQLSNTQTVLRKYGENQVTLGLVALFFGIAVLPPIIRGYVSKRLRKALPAGTKITNGMRLRYLFQDMIGNPILSLIPVAGKYITIPSYIEALKKRVKADADELTNIINNPNTTRADKAEARKMLEYITDLPGKLEPYKLKLMNKSISEYYTNPNSSVDDLLRRTGWANDAALAWAVKIRFPILKKIFNGTYKSELIPALGIANQSNFSNYVKSHPSINKHLNKISGVQSSIKYSLNDKLNNTQLYQDAIYDKYLKLVRSSKFNHAAIDAYYNVANKFPRYKFWKQIQSRSGSTNVSYDEFRKQYYIWTVSRFAH